MKILVKSALVAVSLLLSAAAGFAAEVKTPAPGLKGTVTSVGSGVKTDVKSSAVSTKENTKSAAKAKLVDINTAVAAELKTVPGIGDALAAKIIAGRPYANKSQLKSRKIVSAMVYEQIKDLIIAKMVK